MKKCFYLLLLVSNISGCVTAKFTVKSEPTEAEVFVQNSGSDVKKPIGKTPMTIDFAEIKEKAGVDTSSGEFFELLVEKKGFASEKYLIPAARMGHSETIVLSKLKAQETEGRVAHILLQHLFNAQKMANNREYERAQAELDKAFAIDEAFVRGMSLRASIYFVQKSYDESLKWFEKALSLDPQFEDAVKMITKIKSLKSDPNRQISSEEAGK